MLFTYGIDHDRKMAKRIIRHYMNMADIGTTSLFRPEEARRTIVLGNGEQVDGDPQ